MYKTITIGNFLKYKGKVRKFLMGEKLTDGELDSILGQFSKKKPRAGLYKDVMNRLASTYQSGDLTLDRDKVKYVTAVLRDGEVSELGMILLVFRMTNRCRATYKDIELNKYYLLVTPEKRKCKICDKIKRWFR